MHLFNLLCVDRKVSFEGDLLIPSLIAISLILFLYGIIKMCDNSGKKDAFSKRKFKRGLISFILFIIFAALSLFVASIKSKEIVDPCNNYSPVFALANAIMNIVKIIVPIIFIIKAIIVLLKNNIDKKEKLHKFIMYIVLAIFIFFAITIFSALFGIVKETPKSEGWSTCWC